MAYDAIICPIIHGERRRTRGSSPCSTNEKVPLLQVSPASQGDDKAAFLAEFRTLRDRAALDYDELAARAHYPTEILREAEIGPGLPGLPILAAYVRACGGDVIEWEERWRRLASSAGNDAGLPVRPAGASPAAVAGARAGITITPAEAHDSERIRAALRAHHEREEHASRASVPYADAGLHGAVSDAGSSSAGSTTMLANGHHRAKHGGDALSTAFGQPYADESATNETALPEAPSAPGAASPSTPAPDTSAWSTEPAPDTSAWSTEPAPDTSAWSTEPAPDTSAWSTEPAPDTSAWSVGPAPDTSAWSVGPAPSTEPAASASVWSVRSTSSAEPTSSAGAAAARAAAPEGPVHGGSPSWAFSSPTVSASDPEPQSSSWASSFGLEDDAGFHTPNITAPSHPGVTSSPSTQPPSAATARRPEGTSQAGKPSTFQTHRTGLLAIVVLVVIIVCIALLALSS
jgi:hypothetical protein